jgi:hypothetical protein
VSVCPNLLGMMRNLHISTNNVLRLELDTGFYSWQRPLGFSIFCHDDQNRFRLYVTSCSLGMKPYVWCRACESVMLYFHVQYSTAQHMSIVRTHRLPNMLTLVLHLLHFPIRLLKFLSLLYRHTCELSRVNNRLTPRSLVFPQRAAVAQSLDKCPLLYDLNY